MQTNRTPTRWGSEPPLLWLKWTDDRQTHHYRETGAHILQAVYSVLTPKLERPGGMGRDLDFPGKGGREKSRRVREGEKDGGNRLTGSKKVGRRWKKRIKIWLWFRAMCFRTQIQLLFFKHFVLTCFPSPTLFAFDLWYWVIGLKWQKCTSSILDAPESFPSQWFTSWEVLFLQMFCVFNEYSTWLSQLLLLGLCGLKV